MSRGHSLWLLLICAICGILFLRPREQELKIDPPAHPAAADIERICMPPKFYLPCRGAYCHAPPIPETFT